MKQHKLEIDLITFQPYVEVLGKKIRLEQIQCVIALEGKERAKEKFIEEFGQTVYDEFEDSVLMYGKNDTLKNPFDYKY